MTKSFEWFVCENGRPLLHFRLRLECRIAPDGAQRWFGELEVILKPGSTRSRQKYADLEDDRQCLEVARRYLTQLYEHPPYTVVAIETAGPKEATQRTTDPEDSRNVNPPPVSAPEQQPLGGGC